MAWISKYGYTSLPGTGEEDHDVHVVFFYSRTIHGYVLEMNIDEAMLHGAPRDPQGDAMICSDFADKVGMAIDDQLEPEPEKNPPFDFDLPMIKVDWSVDHSPLGSGVRRRPRARVRRKLLRMQHERCAYCLLTFGSLVRRRSRVEQLRVTWDHRVPFALSQSSSDREFIAACQICNRLKGAIVFETLEDARTFISIRRIRKGWKVASMAEATTTDEWAEWEGRLVTFQSPSGFTLEIAEEVLEEYGPPHDPSGDRMVYAG